MQTCTVVESVCVAVVYCDHVQKIQVCNEMPHQITGLATMGPRGVMAPPILI